MNEILCVDTFDIVCSSNFQTNYAHHRMKMPDGYLNFF